MNTSTSTAGIPLSAPASPPMLGPAMERTLAPENLTFFKYWTLFWWNLSGLCAVLFYFGYMDFTTSAKVSLYGISIWLNGCVIAMLFPSNKQRSKLSMYHDCLVIWMLSYALTNILWEIPWVIFSPFVFDNLHTIEDVVAQTGYMRETPLHMYWWALASFGSVDLRTVNHDPTFYTLEIYAFANVASTFYFLHLNNKRSPYRYLIPVLGCGEPIAATFIFSFTEVFAGFENMAGGLADTLLALVWTQYQYILFPIIFGFMGYKLLQEDWRYCHENQSKTAPDYS